MALIRIPYLPEGIKSNSFGGHLTRRHLVTGTWYGGLRGWVTVSRQMSILAWKTTHVVDFQSLDGQHCRNTANGQDET
jgi:hypothetical protein